MNKIETLFVQVVFTVVVGASCYFYGVHRQELSQSESDLYQKEEKIKWLKELQSLI